MYDEICTIYQSGLFDESVFVTMFAPYVMAYWREAHCLISHLRKRPSGVADADLLSAWETTYWQLMDANVKYPATPDSDPGALRPTPAVRRRPRGGWFS
jgi:hypothetical protein